MSKTILSSALSALSLISASAPCITAQAASYQSTTTYNPNLSYDTRLSMAKAGTQVRRTHYPTLADGMFNSKVQGNEYYGPKGSLQNHRARPVQSNAINPYICCEGVKNNSDLADALPNCIAYAWGRTYETMGYGTAKALWEITLGNIGPARLYNQNVSKKVFAYGKIPKNNSLLITSGHVRYVEKAQKNSNGTYTLEITDSNLSANGQKANDWWSQRPNSKDTTNLQAAWRSYKMTINPSTSSYGNQSYLGCIYLTQPQGKYIQEASQEE